MRPIDQEYMFYQLAYKLVDEQEYNIFSFDDDKKEIWLEKIENETPLIIRIICRGLDWKKQMIEDSIKSFTKFSQTNQMITGGTKVIFKSVYISTTTPLDHEIKVKSPIRMTQNQRLQHLIIYYMDDLSSADEDLMKFLHFMQMSSVIFPNEAIDSEKEKQTKKFQSSLTKTNQKKEHRRGNIFLFGKPSITYILILINLIIFIGLELNGGSTDIKNLIKFGAKFNPFILEGEWWRIITSMFLHIGFIHLLMNMFALYYLGLLVERIYGSQRFLIIYLFAGIIGSLASFTFSFRISAGASGAIFGLFGALLFFGVIHKKVFLQTMGRGILMVIFINIILGIAVPQIDMGAHLGGLVGGFLASGMTHLPRNKNNLIQIPALIIYLLFAVGLTYIGIENTKQHMIEERSPILEFQEETASVKNGKITFYDK